MFPIHENISGRNWSKIKDNAPAPTDPGPTLGSISKNLKDITKGDAIKKDLYDMNNLFTNLIGLPDDVKLIYLHRQNKKCINKTNIKKFQDDLTVKPGDVTNTQVELDFI